MKEKIQALMQKLSSVSSGKFSLSGANLKKGLSHKTSREKVILAVGITIAVFMFLFVVGIRPTHQEFLLRMLPGQIWADVWKNASL